MKKALKQLIDTLDGIFEEHEEVGDTAVRQFMYDAVHKPAAELRRGETTPFVHAAGPAAQVPKWASPEAIVLIVAGGEAGRYSAVLGPCTGMGSQIVSREVGSPWPLTT